MAMYVSRLLWSSLMRLFLGFAPPLEEARLRLNGLYNPRLENMEKAVFRQMEEHGARIFLNVEHHFHSSHQKSLIERTIQYVKDKTECFDGCFPCKKGNDCRLKRVMNWLGLYVSMHQRAIMETIAKRTEPNCNNTKLLMRM